MELNEKRIRDYLENVEWEEDLLDCWSCYRLSMLDEFRQDIFEKGEVVPYGCKTAINTGTRKKTYNPEDRWFRIADKTAVSSNNLRDLMDIEAMIDAYTNHQDKFGEPVMRVFEMGISIYENLKGEEK